MTDDNLNGHVNKALPTFFFRKVNVVPHANNAAATPERATGCFGLGQRNETRRQ